VSNIPQTTPIDDLVVQESKPKLKRPRLYKVLLLNDDYTPMEFVVIVLEQFFAKPREQAVQIMLHVHQKGVGVCGVFPREVAETKVRMVLDFAQENQHPLQCTMEPESGDENDS
jgi:ATP-dependent Clp protease adaptor protein ClpS